VRQCEENAVKIGETREVLRRALEAQVGQPVQIPVNLADGLPRPLIRRDERDLRVRVRQQDAQQLRAAVARPAEDADFDFQI